MPTAITGLSDEGPGRPVPVVSALVEFGSALHVLRDPGHHDAATWAAGVRTAMSPRLADWTQAWWWTAQAIRATPFVTIVSPASDFPALLAHGTVLGGDGRVAAGGQSAGAALVAGTCLLARDQHHPAAAWQILCYPLLDFGQDTESARQFDGIFHSIKPGWTADQYLAGQPVTAYAAPIRATSLAGLPPALIIGAGRDPLRDDARAYAARLDADGVNVTHVEYAGTMHAFLNFSGALSAGDHAIELIAAELISRFKEPVREPDRGPAARP